jgi:hypothetical protein
VKPIIRRKLANPKRRIARRLDKTDNRGCAPPMFTARNIDYEIADRARGMAHGGIGVMHLLARRGMNIFPLFSIFTQDWQKGLKAADCNPWALKIWTHSGLVFGWLSAPPCFEIETSVYDAARAA